MVVALKIIFTIIALFMAFIFFMGGCKYSEWFCDKPKWMRILFFVESALFLSQVVMAWIWY